MLVLIAVVADRIVPGYGTITAVVAGVGTISLPFATLFFGHALASALAFAGFALLFKDRRYRASSHALAGAGLLEGLAITTELPLAVIALVLVPYATSAPPRLSRVVWYAAGVGVGVLPLLVYNALAFGSPLHLAYQSEQAQQRGLLGLHPPDGWQLAALLGSHSGVLILTPVMALVAVGLGLLWRTPWRPEAATIGAILVTFLLWNSGYYLPFGGTLLPRFQVPIVGFAAIPLAVALSRFPVTAVALMLISCATMLVATLTRPLNGGVTIAGWWRMLSDREFTDTVWGAILNREGWSSVLPGIALACLAIATALASLPRMAVSRLGLAGAVSAVVVWAAASQFLAPILDEHRDAQVYKAVFSPPRGVHDCAEPRIVPLGDRP
jgi:hypothetical protein